MLIRSSRWSTGLNLIFLQQKTHLLDELGYNIMVKTCLNSSGGVKWWALLIQSLPSCFSSIFSKSMNDKLASCIKHVWCLYLWPVTGVRLNQLLCAYLPDGHHIQKVLGPNPLFLLVFTDAFSQRQAFLWLLNTWLPFNSASLHWECWFQSQRHSCGGWSVWLFYGCSTIHLLS